MKQKILFIDRDGTLINEPKENFQIDSLEKLLFEPNVIPALIELKNFGYKFIIITNQDGLGSKTFPQKKFDVPHNFMLKIFSSQGIKFDQILICPHLPSNKCNCRKPKIGLIKPWLEKNNLDKNNSYVIGDRETDVILAKNIKIKSIKYHKEKFNWEKIKNILIYENRNAHIHRTTKETDINIEVWLDKYHESYINTGIYFFNHLLQQIAIHAGIQMNILAKGDLYIDDHHIIEDTALTLGEALNQALKNKRGIERFGFTLPMDESVAQCILDLSGRPFFNYKANFNFQKIGDLSTEMIEHFFRSLTYKMACTLHLKTLGNNDHHKAESLFKCFGRSLRQAICINNKNFIIPSSKGTLI